MSGFEDLRFRSLAAPGLDEDDLFVAMHGLPGAGALWGEGRPPSVPPGPPDPPWDEAAERRRRHDALLVKWEASTRTSSSGAHVGGDTGARPQTR